MEFLRFGSSIPGEYWGCCAADIIQNFNQHPDTKASIQLVDGDAGAAITERGELAFAGPTLRDVFETRIRIGTFGKREMPNHAFFAILTDSQCSGGVGKAWLEILKQHGFEYLRTVNNSVWNVNNHIFVLIRNAGPNARKDMFAPPSSWTALASVVPEPYAMLGDTAKLTADISKAQAKAWGAGKTSIKTESEIIKAKAPLIMAGLRTEFPPQLKDTREKALAARKETGKPMQPSAGTQHLY
jgi:hypothetical protein